MVGVLLSPSVLWTRDLPFNLELVNQLNALNPTHSTVANSWFVLISSMHF